MGEVTMHQHPPLYCYIHLTITILPYVWAPRSVANSPKKHGIESPQQTASQLYVLSLRTEEEKLNFVSLATPENTLKVM
jgi:hypothetical protein